MENKIDNFSKEVTTTINQQNQILNLLDLKGETVIFVIDMTNGFCKEGNLSSPLINSLVPKIKTLIKKAITNQIEVIALNDAHSKNNPEFNSYQEHCLENTIEAKLVTELTFPEIKILNKNSTNGFFILETTKKWTWQNMIVVGCCTDICVYQFALTCKAWCNQQNQNINIIVPKSMTTTFDSVEHPSTTINFLAWYSMLKNGITIVGDIV